jgi:hypothetical protein
MKFEMLKYMMLASLMLGPMSMKIANKASSSLIALSSLLVLMDSVAGIAERVGGFMEICRNQGPAGTELVSDRGALTRRRHVGSQLASFLPKYFLFLHSGQVWDVADFALPESSGLASVQ